MSEERQSVFREIEGELLALHAAIVASDLVAVERHTSVASNLLQRLRPLRNQSLSIVCWQERVSVHLTARSTLILLNKARRTVRALTGVYRLLLENGHQPSPESR